MKHDVVIIGSGLGALVCGSLLAQAGKSVLLLERQLQPGGCMQSYRRKGLLFDTGLHYVGGLAPGQRLHKVFSRLGLMSLPWVRLDAEGFDRVTIGQHTYCFAEGYQQFADTMAGYFPSERKALLQFVTVLQLLEDAPLESSLVQNYFGQSAYGYLNDTFSDPLLVNVLAGTALKMELRRDSLPLFTFAHGNSSFIGSSWRLKGSGQQLVQALAENIRAAGGNIVCQAEVVELIEKSGQISAARCRNGEVYEGRAFISDVHPAQTFALLKESGVLKKLFRRRISCMENTNGMFTVSLVLKPDTLPYFNHNKFVYRKPNVWTMCDDEAECIGGVMVSARVPEDGSKHVRQVDLLTPMPWHGCQLWTDTKIGRRGADYVAMKNRLADQCVELAEREIPGLRQLVVERHTSTPLTWRDYTMTPDGSAYGVRKDYRNPMMTILSPRTPIPNLLLTGQNLLLHGVEGVTMTALMTCGELLGKDYIRKCFEL